MTYKDTKMKPPKSIGKSLQFLFEHQRISLSILLLVLSAIPFISNYLQEQPLLKGGESYYYLSLAQQDLPYHPLTLLFKVIPDQAAFLLPVLISIGILLLFYSLAEKIGISEKKKFFIGLIYALTPTFIFTSITLSSYSLFLLASLFGANLLLQETKKGSKKKYFSFIPLLIASWIDIFTGFLLLAGLAIYFFVVKKNKSSFPIVLVMVMAILVVANTVLLKAPFFLGPFQIQNKTADLISDLGSVSGVGVFTLLLAFIGFITTWKRKNIQITIPALIIFTTAYLFNTQTIFFLSLLIIVLAAHGFVDLLEQNWKLPFVRNAVILLLLLGVFFSTVSYYDRLSGYSPTAIDQKALEWISRNTAPEAVVLSAPENSYYLSYFAERKPVFFLHHDYKREFNLSKNIFSAFYIEELFPLLEKNKVSIIYISEKMKKELPPQQEFLFLLQNERFKLLYSTGDTEIWSFNEAGQ